MDYRALVSSYRHLISADDAEFGLFVFGFQSFYEVRAMQIS
jgi:hypothetical protein